MNLQQQICTFNSCKFGINLSICLDLDSVLQEMPKTTETTEETAKATAGTNENVPPEISKTSEMDTPKPVSPKMFELWLQRDFFWLQPIAYGL